MLSINEKENNKINATNVTFVKQDIFTATGEERKYNIIVSNPPYIKTNEIPFLDIEVKNFDPLIALDGGDDGLRDYRRISQISANLLKDDGFLLFEVGENQALDVINIGNKSGFATYEILKDLNNIERCIILKK